jgi:hypothetical protein
MVRIFKPTKDVDYVWKCIAGEMLNLECGKRIWRCDKKIGGTPKPYPKIKLDTCSVIPNLNIGFIYIPTKYIDTFEEKITPYLNEMSDDSRPIKMFINMSAYCSIEAPVKIQRMFYSNKMHPKISTDHFQWILSSFPGGIINGYGKSSFISSIICDLDNLCLWEHDVIFFKQISFEDLKLFTDNNIIKLTDSKYMSEYALSDMFNDNFQLIKLLMLHYFVRINTIKILEKNAGIGRGRRCYGPEVFQPVYNTMRKVQFLKMSWENAKKFVIYCPVAQKPIIDTRRGCEINSIFGMESNVVNIPEESYVDEIRNNTCITCGLQLYGTIYGIPLAILHQFNTLYRKYPNMTLGRRKFIKPTTDVTNMIALMCMPCIYSGGINKYTNVKGRIYQIDHPASFKKYLKLVKPKLGNIIPLIKSIRNATTIQKDNAIIIIKTEDTTSLYCLLKNSQEMMGYYDEIKKQIDLNKGKKDSLILYVQKTDIH